MHRALNTLEKTAVYSRSLSTVDLLSRGDITILAHDAFLKTNRSAIDTMFVRPSAYLSVCLGRACIVITRCTSARI